MIYIVRSVSDLKKSIKMVWLTVCVVCVALFGLILLCYNLKIKDSVQKLETQSNTNNVMHVKSVMDEMWNDLMVYSFEQYYSSSALKFKEAQTEDDFIELGAYSLMTRIQRIWQQNTLVEDMMFYYPNSDYIIGRYGVYSAETYWLASYCANPQNEWDIWNNTLFSEADAGLFLLNSGTERGLYLRVICLQPQSNKCVLVVKINMDEVKKRLSWVGENTQTSFLAISDADGNLYSYIGSEEIFVAQPENRLAELNDAYIIMHQDSSSTGLQYVSISEKSQIFRLSSRMIPITILVLLLACCISISVGAILVRLNTTPIALIAEVFEQNADNQRNEFEIINTGVRGLIQRQSELLTLANQQQIMINRSFLHEFLFQNPSFRKSAETIAAFFGFSLDGGEFRVAASRRAPDTENMEIEKILSEWSDRLDIYWTEENSIDIFLLNYEATEALTAEAFLSSLTKKICPPPEQVVYSQPVSDSTLIAECWMDCAEQIGCKEMVSQDRKFSLVGQKEKLLTDLIDCLENGNFAAAQQMSPAIFDACVFNEDAFIFECNRYNIVNMLLNYCPDSMRIKLIELAQADEKVKWLNAFRFFLMACALPKKQSSGSPNSDVATRVCMAIESMYSNPALDLRMISDLVGFSQPYVSKRFKEKYNISISQYLNKVRIDHAKELIVGGNENIKAVAMKVGFAGDTQFIRAFKRIENTTPGSLRNINLGSKQLPPEGAEFK